MTPNPNFFKMLAESGRLSQEEASALRVRHRNDAFAALRELAGTEPSRKAEWAKFWADILGVAHVELEKTLFQAELVKKVPRKFAESRNVIPLYSFGETVTLAAADPLDDSLRQGVSGLLGAPASLVFAWPEEIAAAIEIQYQDDGALQALVRKIAEKPMFSGGATVTEEQLKAAAGDQAVVEFAHDLLLLAAKERASDIHIEPGEKDVRVRFRVDGMLRERLTVGAAVLPPLTSRLKILAGADITEKRKPQDGRIALPLPGRNLDLRFSSIPTIYGEKLVMRLLGQLSAASVPDLGEVGFSKSNMEKVLRILEHPNGVFLVTGPTGSGKSTTLYAMLRHLNKPDINIMTAEDPVEYRLRGLNQVQVNPAVQLDFGTALRSFLRQDPDVILLGEIRDSETARVALQAAMTGHLVLSTLHANSAVQAITRLVDIGVEPFLVAPAMLGAMAQRLVRRICPKCREAYRMDPGEADELFANRGEREVTLYRGRGCEACGGSGYAGRLAIHEVFVVDDAVRRLVSRNAPAAEIQEAARAAGFASMRYDGVKKALRGLTTLHEVDRVALED